MNLRKNGTRLRWLLVVAALMLLTKDAKAGGPHESGRYMPQQRFHGYYPTIWRPWAPGWQAPISKEHMPVLRQKPAPAPRQEESFQDDDAPPTPPATQDLPLQPFDENLPGMDEAPDLPTPPGLEGISPEPSTPGEVPESPGLEELMPEPATPEGQPDPSPFDDQFQMPEELPLDSPPETEDPGLTPPDLDEMPDPTLPPGFETPGTEDQPPLETPSEGAQPEPSPPEGTSRIPTSGWTRTATSSSSGSVGAKRKPLHNRLRRTTLSADPAYNMGRRQAEPRRLSAIPADIRPLPQRLPPPSNQTARPATQARFNVPATSKPRIEATSDQYVVIRKAASSQRNNPLRTEQPSARKVVRRHNPLR